MSLIATTTEDTAEPHVWAIKSILETDTDEVAMAAMLREYCGEHLSDMELGAEVHDRLAKYKIISKANFRALWNIR
jgi:hypothetical protein